jgi:hypothetical protein
MGESGEAVMGLGKIIVAKKVVENRRDRRQDRRDDDKDEKTEEKK